jgi:hypothetical protein
LTVPVTFTDAEPSTVAAPGAAETANEAAARTAGKRNERNLIFMELLRLTKGFFAWVDMTAVNIAKEDESVFRDIPCQPTNPF